MNYTTTEWGRKVKVFSAKTGMTLKQIAAAADVKYPAFLQVLVGKTPGSAITEKVDSFMKAHSETLPRTEAATPEEWSAAMKELGNRLDGATLLLHRLKQAVEADGLLLTDGRAADALGTACEWMESISADIAALQENVGDHRSRHERMGDPLGKENTAT